MFDHFHFRVRLKEGEQSNEPITPGKAPGAGREGVVRAVLPCGARQGAGPKAVYPVTHLLSLSVEASTAYFAPSRILDAVAHSAMTVK